MKDEIGIFCEGYHDRSFWAGWLLLLGCEALGGPGRTPALDPWGKKLPSGEYAYKTPRGRFVRLKPCQGITEVIKAARLRLLGRETQPVTRVILNADLDEMADGTVAAGASLTMDAVLAMAQQLDSGAQARDGCTVEMDSGRTLIHLLHWRTERATASGIPHQETLERIICTAITEAHPLRAGAVDNWLTSRPHPLPPEDPKAHAWSYMAGWYCDGGCDGFYTRIWNEPTVQKRLRDLLTTMGVWAMVENVINEQLTIPVSPPGGS